MFIEEYIIGYNEDAVDRLDEKLAELRQAIIQAEKSVLLDGRFERMIISPLTTLSIATELINQLAALPRSENETMDEPVEASMSAERGYRQTR